MKRSLDELTPNPRNPRSITPGAAEALAKSLAELGDLGCIIRNDTTGNLVGGHQRLAILKAAPNAKITITKKLAEADETGTTAYGHIEANGTRYAYREVAWDPKREAAAMIAANQHGGEFVEDGLKALIADLDSVNLDLLGFDADELNALLPPPPPPDGTTTVVGSHTRTTGTNPPAPFNYQTQYGVIVICDSEASQKAVYEKLMAEGHTCRVVAT